MILHRFPVDYQMDMQDCGPACLKIVAKHFGRFYSLQYLRDRCGITNQGVSLLDLSTGAESIGLRTLAIKCTLSDVVNQVPFPAIIFWKESHFIVVYHANKKYIWVSDPAKGRVKYTHEEFRAGWYPKGESIGVLLAIEPTIDFQRSSIEKELEKNSFISILRYFIPYKNSFATIFFIMLVATLLQGILPFISKAVIDVGIKTTDINFINMVLIGNICILLSITIFNVIRDWILLHITSRVNIALISDYLIKLMKLPVTFFENKLLGDILQRARDHERIRSFIMNNSLSLVFSTLTFIVFSVILLIYNPIIFYIFLSGSILYAAWVLLFLRIRKRLDWEYFELISQDQSYWVETVSAIQDIKIYNYEKHRRWKWEEIQARLYKVNKRVLNVTNMQNLGAQFIENIKNMGIVFFCASAVIKGEITFGVMISTQFIIGMLNGPLVQFIGFVVSAQYAKISFLRMNEIRQLKDEEELLSIGATSILPESRDITLSNIIFQYSPNSPLVLSNIFLTIPQNKVTAIVGGSGSGKSTLLKLLVRLYKPTYGDIKMGNMNVSSINLRTWRNMCGVVMQDGKLFSDTILANIVLDDEHINYDRLHEACKMAQIEDEINGMPKGFDTFIGEKGRGLSGGQKQRLLIARALYRDPDFLFLDEATNSLDVINEKKIVEALNSAFKNRTVIVVAHRLSTIRHADQIVVLHQGRIVEIGNHDNLMERKGEYYNLVSSQSE
ncbi:bacteriocin-processing peptidase. Cysteine peptidase. MEROPS family C39 [Bacteroides faecichinchillae]|uniref:Bacteriocin-processing peptidase. Cysteine peptidase. MEROPS family C39 n=1 Tax=Bacteroides faecichinchillae TaxID=871325 RepID=A0A1M5DHF5_9BACE|nr:peptidase domain-containing ABC transporter [Bacteroides faecichinchillae]THG62134.1 peptidase domain-containing ABC transporter [Bacteroides faecichinchillae]SHF66400.1 bacteriocin-processing peptidase. Cysteine peptidase. MEROPS family C39 [Bacteroides faecichinchillae]